MARLYLSHSLCMLSKLRKKREEVLVGCKCPAFIDLKGCAKPLGRHGTPEVPTWQASKRLHAETVSSHRTKCKGSLDRSISMCQLHGQNMSLDEELKESHYEVWTRVGEMAQQVKCLLPGVRS